MHFLCCNDCFEHRKCIRKPFKFAYVALLGLKCPLMGEVEVMFKASPNAPPVGGGGASD